MATLSASSLSFGSEDFAPPEKKPRTESGDGDKNVWEEWPKNKKDVCEEKEDADSDSSSVPDEEYDEYAKQVKDSDGFDVDYFDKMAKYMFGSIRPYPLIDSSVIKKLIPLTELAIKHFNEKQDANFQFVKLLKLNTGVGGCGINYYITFEAKDIAENQTKTFQAQVWYGVTGIKVELCRLKPPPTKQGVEEKSSVDDITIVAGVEDFTLVT